MKFREASRRRETVGWCGAVAAAWLLLVGSGALATDIERQAIEYRRQIQRAEVVIESSLREPDAEPIDITLHVWFTPTHQRMDRTRPCTNPTQEGSRRCRYVVVLTPEGTIRWSLVADEPAFGEVVSIHPPPPEDEPPSPADAIVDPRMLGMFPVDVSNMVHFQLESFLDRPDAADVEQAEETIDGVRCVRIVRRRQGNVVDRVWIAPDRGPSPVRLESEFPGGGDLVIVDRVDVELRQVGTPGLWFPKTLRYRRTENFTTVREEDAEIEVISLNEPIDPTVFTLAGLGLPAGKPISDLRREDANYAVWDGERAVSIEELEARQRWTGRALLLRGAVALALVAAAAAWRLLR